MTLDDLKSLASRIENILRDKGYNRASCWFSVGPEQINAYVEYYLNSSDPWEHRKTVPGYNVQDLAALLSQIEVLPTRLDLARAEFLKRLANLVEDAEALELNIPELRPLFETYQNNLLTYEAHA